MKIGTTKSTRSKKTKKTGEDTLLSEAEQTQLQDTFVKQEIEQQRRHLIEEHQAKLQALEEVHQKKRAMFLEQAFLTGLRMWHEMWLQRQKLWDDHFKDFIKYLRG